MSAYLKYEYIGGFEETYKHFIHMEDKRQKEYTQRLVIREQKKKMEILLDTYKDIHKFRIPKEGNIK